MATFFLDTSAVVKRYVLEAGTTWLLNLTDPASGNVVFIVRLTAVELTAALARRRKGLTLGTSQAKTALDQFHLEMAQDFRVVELTVPLLDRAARLADRHALRAYDAVQLAAALAIHALEPSLTLISADRELNAAAVAAGLATDDPSTHP